MRTFGSCTSLTEIKLPNSLKTIGYDAFSYCEILKSIAIPNGVTELPGNYSHSNEVFRGVFFDCTNLESVTLPSSLKKIGECTFINCENLKDITIPKGIEVIDRSAFSGCKSLTEISIPDGVTVTYKGSEYNYSNFADLYNAWEEERKYGITIEDIRYYYCCLNGDNKYYIPALDIWTNSGMFSRYAESTFIYDPEQDIWTDWDGNPVDYNP